MSSVGVRWMLFSRLGDRQCHWKWRYVHQRMLCDILAILVWAQKTLSQFTNAHITARSKTRRSTFEQSTHIQNQKSSTSRYLFVAPLFSSQSFASYFAYYSLILHIIHISWICATGGTVPATIKPIGRIVSYVRCDNAGQNQPISKCLYKFMRWQNECDMCTYIHTFGRSFVRFILIFFCASSSFSSDCMLAKKMWFASVFAICISKRRNERRIKKRRSAFGIRCVTAHFARALKCMKFIRFNWGSMKFIIFVEPIHFVTALKRNKNCRINFSVDIFI